MKKGMNISFIGKGRRGRMPSLNGKEEVARKVRKASVPAVENDGAA